MNKLFYKLINYSALWCRFKYVPTPKTLQSLYWTINFTRRSGTRTFQHESPGTLFPVTIQYTQLSTGVATRISNCHPSFLCGQESGGPYSCRVANSLFRVNQMYSFQVAARNSHGDGSFSDPSLLSLFLYQFHKVL